MQKRILVTGGAGFIGSHLVDELIQRGTDPEDIVVIDDLSTGKIENLNETVQSRRVKLYRVNLCHYTVLELYKLLLDTEVSQVYHLAAKARVQPSYAAPNDYILDNVIGTQKLLEACRLAGIKKIVFASSSTVSYLNEKNGKSPYSVSKALAEQLCRMYQELYQMNIVSLRYFSVYGEKMDMSRSNSTVLSRILRSLILKDPFTLYGDGRNSRDFTYVGDIVSGTISTMEKIESLKDTVLELGCTKPVAINSILKLLPDLWIDKQPAVTEIPITMSNSTHAHYSIGYEYRTDVLDWFKEQVNNLDYWKQRLELYEN